MADDRKRNDPPKCERCGASEGAQFNVFGAFEFGRFCVPCEREILAGSVRRERHGSDAS